MPSPRRGRVFFQAGRVSGSSLLDRFRVFVSHGRPMAIVASLVRPGTLPKSTSLPRIGVVRFCYRRAVWPLVLLLPVLLVALFFLSRCVGMLCAVLDVGMGRGKILAGRVCVSYNFPRG